MRDLEETTIGAQRTGVRPAVLLLFRAMGPVAARLSILTLLCLTATAVSAQTNGEIMVLGGNNQTNPLHSVPASPLSVTIWNTCDVDGCIEGTVTFTVQDSTYAVLCAPDHRGCLASSQATYNTSGGEVNVAWLTVSKAGAFQITATNNATGHSVAFDLTNTAGPPASIVTILGTPQSASTGTAFANALEVDVQDADGNHTGDGLVVTFTAPTGEPTARFSGSTTAQGTVHSAHGFAGAGSGIPTAGQVGGSYSVIATAPGVPGQAVFSLTNIAPLTAACLPTNGPAEVNVAYSATCTASGGTSPYTFSVTPNPPAGVTLSSFTATTATISGSPTSPGAYSYVVKVTDAASLTASQSYSGAVAPAPSLNCVPTTGPTEVGVAYSTTCTASGGTSPYTFFVNPNPPAGVNLSSFTATTVTVSGIPTSSGSYSYVVRVTDAATQSASQAYSGTVAPAPSLNCLSTTGPTEVGVAYSTTCTASGGTSPYTFFVTPNPPAGVTLSSFTATTATVSGSPTSSGGYSYVVQVTDAASQSASQSYNGAVAPAPSVNCLPTTGPTEVNVPYSATCTVSGGTSPYTWSINPGTLPAGVNLSSNTGTSVTISGSPASSGGYNYTVKATDAASQSAAQSYSGVILGAVSISCLPTAGPAEVSVAYSATCTVSGGTSPYTWSINSGALPTGVNLSSNTGTSVTISGSPASSGSYNYTVQASDSASQSAAQSFSGTVAPLPVLTSLNPASATVGGTAFTLTANGSGFTSGASVQWNGSGLSTVFVNAGQLTASVPAALIASVGSAAITVSSGGATSNTVSFPINNPTPVLTSLSPTGATVGGPAFTLTANGSGFASGATVQWNGSGLSTVFVNGGQLTATVPAALIAAVGTATITVASSGITSNSVNFPVTAGCSLQSPAAFTFGSAGGSGTVHFNSACQWTVTGNPSWVVLPASSGTGPSFSFTIQPNTGGDQKTTLNINGGALTVAITQTGLVCTYTISGSTGSGSAGLGVSRSFPSSGGSGGISVAAPAGCAWTAAPDQSFIAISGNASGNGNGSVSYSIAANSSSTNAPSGTITIAGLAYAINEQPAGSSPYSCSASSTVSPIRPEGYSERVADVVLVCAGEAPPGGVTGDIVISFNSNLTTAVNVTNHLLSSGQTDALLLEDEPAAADLALGTNAFRGLISSVNGTSTILFPSVQLASAGGGAFSHTWRITNARVNAQALGAMSTLQAAVSINATQPFAVTSQPTVAQISSASTFAVPGSSTTSGQTVQPVRFTEGFATAFEPRLAAGQDPSQAGTVYRSESGYLNTTILGSETGFATSGTRLITAITNVPAGVSVYAPVAPVSGTNAVLVSADATGAGGSPLSGSSQFNGANYQQLVLAAGAGAATWEVMASDPNSIETLTFNLVLVNPSNASLAGITYAGALAPLSSGLAPQLPNTSLAVPRFASSTVPVTPPNTVGLSVAPLTQVSQGQSQGAALQPSFHGQATPGSFAVGGRVTWTQLQANTGPASASTAPNVSVGGTLPPSWVLTNCLAEDGGVCPPIDPNNPSNAYIVTYPSLSPGQTGTVTLTAESVSQSSGVVELATSIDSDVANSDLAQGSFTANFPVSQIGLNVTLTHSSNFSQGQAGAQYDVTVANGGSLPTSLPVTVTEILPASLTLASMTGDGWTCTTSTSSCTRSDVLGANSSFPSITVTVNVASIAPTTVTNQVVATTGVLQATGSDPTNITAGTASPHPPFFSGEVSLGSGVYYLQFPNSNIFGYYNYQFFPVFYHYDLGFEYFLDAKDGKNGAYFYDFASGHWFYTSPSYPFPYLYDFTLQTILYYYPDLKNPGHYSTSPRAFYNFAAGKIITM